ncbi:MAG: hypothetical protein MUF15_25695 [Acidobacteria bacterium]|nr:hypothetical protein [Acidobacteriota bacterium]
MNRMAMALPCDLHVLITVPIMKKNTKTANKNSKNKKRLIFTGGVRPFRNIITIALTIKTRIKKNITVMRANKREKNICWLFDMDVRVFKYSFVLKTVNPYNKTNRLPKKRIIPEKSVKGNFFCAKMFLPFKDW